MSLGGDLLRVLARGAIQAGMGAGLGYLNKSWAEAAQEKAQAQNAVVHSLIPLMATGSDEERTAVGDYLGQLTGKNLPKVAAPVLNPAGAEALGSTGQALTIPSNVPLAELAGSGIIPKTKLGYVQPPGRLEDLRTDMLQRLSPEARYNAMFPKDMSLQAAALQGQLNRETKQEEGAANRDLRMEIAKMSNESRMALGEMMAGFHKESLDMRRQQYLDTLEQKRQQGESEAERKGRDAEKRTLLGWADKISRAPDKKIRDQLMAQGNAFIQNSKFHQDFPMFTKEESVSHWYNPLTWGSTKTVAPGMQGEAPAAPAPQSPTTPTLSREAAIQKLKERGYKQDASGQWVK